MVGRLIPQMTNSAVRYAFASTARAADTYLVAYCAVMVQLKTTTPLVVMASSLKKCSSSLLRKQKPTRRLSMLVTEWLPPFQSKAWPLPISLFPPAVITRSKSCRLTSTSNHLLPFLNLSHSNASTIKAILMLNPHIPFGLTTRSTRTQPLPSTMLSFVHASLSLFRVRPAAGPVSFHR